MAVVTEIIEGITVYAAGLVSGFMIWYDPKPPSDRELLKYMNRVVNQEQLEEQRRQLRLNMLRAGQKSARFDGGPHARIMRMRISPKRREK